MPEPDGLSQWESWTQELDKQRRMLRFQVDRQRREIIDRIADLVAGRAAPPLLRLAGPPGVGKTRAVHYALEQALSAVDRRRVRCADDLHRRGWRRVYPQFD